MGESRARGQVNRSDAGDSTVKFPGIIPALLPSWEGAGNSESHTGTNS